MNDRVSPPHAVSGRPFATSHYLRRLESRLLRTVVSSRTKTNVVALTFDDGPDPASTPAVLDVLDRFEAEATFFVLGRNVAAHPELARRIVGVGHAIGNHSFSHPDLRRCGAVQIAGEFIRCARALRRATGVRPRFLRPPFGFQSPAAGLIARALGYTVTHWSISANDWRGEPAAVLVDRVLSQLQPGAIILLHDALEPPPESSTLVVSYDRVATVDALPRIIEGIRNEGYRLVTVPQLLCLAPVATVTWDSGPRARPPRRRPADASTR